MDKPKKGGMLFGNHHPFLLKLKRAMKNGKIAKPIARKMGFVPRYKRNKTKKQRKIYLIKIKSIFRLLFKRRERLRILISTPPIMENNHISLP